MESVRTGWACRFACICFGLAGAASAATITVTTTADDTTPGDGSVSLREAITAINAGNDLSDPDIAAQAPGVFGTNDTIHFAIPGSGVHTITPASALPPIFKKVTVDGYTQLGASPNSQSVGQGLNTVLRIELAGTNGVLGAGTAASSGTVIRGLVLASVSFGPGSSGNAVEGCFVGTNAAGTAASGFGLGVTLGSDTTTIGGTTPDKRNLISGNLQGISFTVLAGADNNVIQGNLIGTDITGTSAIPNGVGISVYTPAAGTLIGGTVAGARNVVSGNTNQGILLWGSGFIPGAPNVVQGNLVGTDVTGTVSLGNGSGGVYVTDNFANVLIGGTAPGAGNVISGNGQEGIRLTQGNTVQGNLIGTNAAGTAALGAQTIGIEVFGSNNLIGGTAAGAANIIAYHNTGITPYGITVDSFTSGNGFLMNSIHDNGTLGGIAFGFPPPNPDTVPPVLTSATINAGSVMLSGNFNSVLAASTTFRVEFFSNVSCDTVGFGEGRTFLGFQSVTTDASGQILSFGPFSFTVPGGETVFTATATSPSNSTSRFSTCITGSSASPPTLVSATSRRTHGLAGPFDLPLSLTSTGTVNHNPATEPRQGPAQMIVFTFDKPITGATATVTEGVATAGAPTFSGSDVVVALTGVSNQQYVTVTLTNVASLDGGTGGNGEARVGFLLGDVNQTRVVSVADLGLVNAVLTQLVTAANFLKDVNTTGTLTVADKGIANANLTRALPPP